MCKNKLSYKIIQGPHSKRLRSKKVNIQAEKVIASAPDPEPKQEFDKVQRNFGGY